MRKIYLDNSSITPIDKKVLEEMGKYSIKNYGNPSSLHSFGVEAKTAVVNSRKNIAKYINANPQEIIFTSGGTEANNLAIIGLYENLIGAGKKPAELCFITSKIEHASVLECARYLEKKGVEVDCIGVNGEGVVDVKEIKEKLRPETFLVSIMQVNNEIGTIQPIAEISELLRSFRNSSKVNCPLSHVLFHVDASQSPLWIRIDAKSLGADLITTDGQKIHGPRGIGFLWKRKEIDLEPIIKGGGQERGMRSGTENVSAIVGLAKAWEIAEKSRGRDCERIECLRDYFIRKLLSIDSRIEINGSKEFRIPGNVNASFPWLDNEFFTLQLDAKGIAVSTKSSCLRDEEESYVIRALGKKEEVARSSVRFSLGRDTTKTDLNFTLKVIENILKRARKI